MGSELVSKFRSYRLSVAAASLSFAAMGNAIAQSPAAGTNVVNQASVQYTDATGAEREATTNEVVLFVQAVYASTLEADQSRDVAAGSAARFVHTLTNTGNSENTFCISATDNSGDDGDYDRIDAVFDANGDGFANPDEQIVFSSSTGGQGELTLDRGERGSLIAIGDVPASAVVDDEFGLTLTVSSKDGTVNCGTGQPDDIGADGDATHGTNTDLATVSAHAILEVYKSSTYSSGAANDLSDDQIDYTISIRNVGLIAAADVDVTDTLPTEVTFDSFITSANSEAHLAGVITASITSLAPDTEVVIQFTTNVDPTLGFSGGDLEIENIASASGNLDGVAGAEPSVESNTVVDLIDPVYGVVLSDIGGSASPGVNDGADDDAAIDDVQTIDVIAPGETAEFTLTVTNTGNVTDTYNLSDLSRAGWFSGAGIRYLNADFVTPLLDTTGDGQADTGPLEPGESLTFMVKAAMSFTEPSAPHVLALQAISTAELSGGGVNVSDPASLAIGTGLAAGVDIANSAGAAGFNDTGSVDSDPASVITTTQVTAPGQAVIFDLFVANEGSGIDMFEFTAHSDAIASTDLPIGWGALFLGADGEPVSASPALSPAETYAFQARITPPDDTTNGQVQSVFFQAASFETGVTDIKQDAVQISIALSLSLSPDQFGQIAACGRKEYLHTLRNSGGTNEAVELEVTAQSNLMSEVLLPTAVNSGAPSNYQDQALLNPGASVAILSDGIWTTGILGTGGSSNVAVPLQPGEETRILARIIAGCDVPAGAVDVFALEAVTSDDDASSSIVDTTTVASARLDLTKLGALDAGCLGGADTAFDDAGVRAEPGDCVIWQITLENPGVETVCDVVARDTAPSFTSISGTPLITQQPIPGTGICNLSGNEFACSVGNSIDIDDDAVPENHCLRSGEQAQVQFSVAIE